MTRRISSTASIACAPLIDAPRKALSVAHRAPLAWQLVDAEGSAVLCLLAPGAVRLPYAMVVSSLPVLGSPSIPLSVSVGDGSLRWGDVEVGVHRWWTPARPTLPRLRAHVDDAAAEALADGWRARLGRGEGLTPYADDVLCGALVTLVSAGHPLAGRLAGSVRSAHLEASTTATSAALLRHAALGWCIDELAAYLTVRAIDPGTVDPDELDHVTGSLSAVGHSSGRGLIDGVCRMIGPPTGSRPWVAA